jgi:alpha-L-rhamnosidase
MTTKRALFMFFLLCFTGSLGTYAVPAAAQSLTPKLLKCENATAPLGVDDLHPRLSWIVESAGRNQKQTAYQLLVSGSESSLRKNQGDYWDSGKIQSDDTSGIRFGGRPLKSLQRVFWKVKVWDGNGKPSPWSAPASWTMGMLDDSDWKAGWVGAAGKEAQSLLLRRGFKIEKPLSRAVAVVSGMGHYELSVNGRKAGDDLLAPGWTKYDKTCLYDTLDITGMLRRGDNAVGLVLGNGMYNVPGGRYTKFTGSFGPIKAIALIRLEFSDGTAASIGTDSTWKTHPGPIVFSCVFGGEDHDARREQKGWNSPGFNETKWEQALETAGPGGKLRGLSAAAPPIRAHDILKPVRIRNFNPGLAVYDLGQNASLIPRITVHGPAGAIVRITPAELLDADGLADRTSVGGAKSKAYWQYTLAGHETESWFPKFFYHGCRYLQVETEPGQGGSLPAVESLVGVVVHSSAAPVGEFSCSNDLFNRTRSLIRWAQRSNMMSVLTDCPHREKLGWLEQIHLNGPSLRYEFDLSRLFEKSMNDMADSQLADGLVPDIAPEYVVFKGGFRDSPEWGSALILTAWQQYEWTGDDTLLRRHYEGMKRYLAYLGSKSRAGIVSHGLGDWYDLGPKPPGSAQLTPIPLTATAFYFADAQALARIAAILGLKTDSAAFAETASQIQASFNREFFHGDGSYYSTGSQCANALPLVLGMVEPSQKTGVLEAIVRDVRGRANSLTAGDVGYRYLLRALADGGRSDVIFDMNSQSDRPGYGYQLDRGATSLPEAWDAGRSSSQNHFMLGHIMEWFYHDLAGIGCDPAEPGFKKILIRPQPAGDVTWARAAYQSQRGRIEVAWKKQEGMFLLDVVIPANTNASVFLPAAPPDKIREGGQPLERSPGVKFIRMGEGRAVLEAGSGTYHFSSPL